MPQDIRNFFISSSAKGEVQKKVVKKRIINDSDDDDILSSPVAKRNKRSQGKAKSPRKKSPEKNVDKKETSKYFEVSKSKLNVFFSKEPVKRISQPTNEKYKKKKQEDDQFEDNDMFAALMHSADEDLSRANQSQSSGFFSQSPTAHSLSPPNSPEQNEVIVTTFTSSAKKKQLENAEECSNKSPKSSSKQEPKRSPRHNIEKVSSKKLSVTKSPNKKEVQSPPKLKPQSPKKEVQPKKTPDKKVLSTPFKKVDKTSDSFAPVSRPLPSVSELLVDKYKPSTIKQIVGQQGEKSNVNKLIRWLRDWHKNQFGGKKCIRPSPWAKDDTGAYFKAALLSGPPGIGKTTTAHLVCKELGMDVVEFNASDTRSKKLLSQQVSELLSSKSLTPYFSGDGETSSRHVLVMDEVDGMAGNEDRGGVQELIQLIKSSRVPIICMCNDRNHPKIRSLANYCFDLRFSKPRAEQIKGFMMSVCFKEKINVKPDQLMDIIVNSNQDIRLILNHLSMLATSQQDLKASTKDMKMGPWDVVKKVFDEKEHKTMTIHDKSDLFFNDYSIAPLFVQENYLQVIPHSEESKTKLGKIKLFAKAAQSIAYGDLVDKAIRSNNSWSLLPTQAMFSSLVPGDLLEGHMGGMINFPQWLGKNSRKNKLDRFAQEIQAHSRLRVSSSQVDISLDYARALLDHVTVPLSAGSEGAAAAASALFEYGLLREDLDSLIELTSWPGRQSSNFASLDPKVKAAFTRACNKDAPVTPFSSSAGGIKKKAKSTEEEWGSSEELSEDENIEESRADAFIVTKKKKKDKKDSTEGKTVKTPRGSKTTKGVKGGSRGRGKAYK